MCALFGPDELRCWGVNGSGELGSAVVAIGDEPGEMPPPLVDTGGPVVQVVGGVNRFCAVLVDGGVRCWGTNESGQLGYGDTKDIGKLPGSMPPPLVQVGGKVSALAVGSQTAHACALLEAQTVRCWGGVYGIGYGIMENLGDEPGEMPPGDVSIGGPAVQVMSAGLNTCAILQSGDLRCWGAGTWGANGQGDSTTIGLANVPSDFPPVQLF